MDKNKIVAAHCELDDKFLKIRYSDLKSYLKARPNVAEAICIDQFVNLQSSANHIGFHICHVSTKESVEILRAKKSAGFKVTAEVAPHHLFLNVDSNLKKGFGKVNPPLRTIDDQNALLAALNNGTIDMIASDHAPHLVSEKNLPFEEAESGLPGVETMVPLLLKTVKDGKIPLYRFVALTSTQPAEIFGLNGKGRIETKFDADLIVVNIRDVRKICAEHLHSLCNWTPYENFEAIFPSHLMIRGEWIVENFEFTLERYGRFLKL
jgi:dihydroorotase